MADEGHFFEVKVAFSRIRQYLMGEIERTKMLSQTRGKKLTPHIFITNSIDKSTFNSFRVG
jgi:hypothetical protein